MTSTYILVANVKGGVGKTTIADELVFAFARRGLHVGYQNLDNQGGGVHEPSMLNGSEEIVVIDTPGSFHRDLPKWCDSADVIIMPTTASTLDLVPLLKCWNVAKESRAGKVAVVVNRFDGRRSADGDILRFLEGMSMPVWGKIPEATAFVKANARMTSVHELSPTGKAAVSIEELASRIIKEVSNGRR